MPDRPPVPRLLQLLQSLTNSEKRAFKKWLDWSHHPNGEQPLRLYEILRKTGFGRANNFSEERCFGKLFPGTPFSNADWNRCKSELYQLTLEFLRQRELAENEGFKNFLERQVLQKKGLTHLHRLRVEAELEKPIRLGLQDLVFDYALRWERSMILDKTKVKSYGSRLAGMLRVSREMYVLERLLLECADLNFRTIYRIYGEERAPLVPVEVDPGDFPPAHRPIVRVLLALRRVLEIHNDGAIVEILNGLPHVLETADRRISKFIVRLLLNHLYQHLHLPGNTYRHQIFDLFKLGFAEELFTDFGKISHTNLLNACGFALLDHEFDWVEERLKATAPRLPEAGKTELLAYLGASIHYARQDYDTALHELEDLSADFTMEPRIRSLRVRIFYDLSRHGYRAQDRFQDELNDFRTWVKKKRVKDYSAARKQSYLSFADCLKMLYDLDRQTHVRPEQERNFWEMIKTQEPRMVPWFTQALTSIKKRKGGHQGPPFRQGQSIRDAHDQD